MTNLFSQKLRDSAKGRPCTFEIPSVCNFDPETTVLCHAPHELKGMGNKGPDYNAAFGCCACHHAMDHHGVVKADEYFYWHRAVYRTQAVWIKSGLMIVHETIKRKPTKKRRDNRPKPKGRKMQSAGFQTGVKQKIPTRGFKQRKTT